MNQKRTVSRSIRTVLVSCVVLLLPVFFFMVPTRVRADGEATNISFHAATNEFAITAQAAEPSPVSWSISYTTSTGIQGIMGSGTTNITNDHHYAGTCSTGGTCTPHTVNSGIFKAAIGNWCGAKRFTVTDGHLSFVDTTTPGASDCSGAELTEWEDAWLEGQTGTLTVCQTVLNEDGTLDDGSRVPGTALTMHNLPSSYSYGPSAADIGDFTFTTPLVYNTDVLSDIPGNDAMCIRKTGLPFGQYHYSEEDVVGSTGWGDVLYNDQYDETVVSLAGFRVYGTWLFDEDMSNDGLRNMNADGQIHLQTYRTGRTILILNQYTAETASITIENEPTPTPTPIPTVTLTPSATPATTPAPTPTPTPSTGGTGENETGGTGVVLAAADTAKTTTGQVLGASTDMLPDTGANIYWLVAAGALITSGVAALVASRRLSH